MTSKFYGIQQVHFEIIDLEIFKMLSYSLLKKIPLKFTSLYNISYQFLTSYPTVKNY